MGGALAMPAGGYYKGVGDAEAPYASEDYSLAWVILQSFRKGVRPKAVSRG